MRGKLERRVSRHSLTLAAAVTNILATRRAGKQLTTLVSDAVLTIVSLWLAFSIRFGTPLYDISAYLHIFILLAPATVLIFACLGVYKWVIRSSTDQLTHSLIKGGLLSSILLLSLMFLFLAEAVAPRSVFAIYGVLFTGAVVLSRYTWRRIATRHQDVASGERVAIYGAGRAGQQLADLMKFDKSKTPVLFIDDNPRLRGSILAGLPVINGKLLRISRQISVRNIDRIIVAIPSIGPEQYSAIIKKLTTLQVPVQTLPNLDDIVSGRASVDQVRDISVADLLGRSVVEPDYQLMRKSIEHKVVLVTGGGGSIGAELCRQIIPLNPAKLIVYDQSEENLYRISEEMSALLGTQYSRRFVAVLGSVTSKEKLNLLFKEYKINTVLLAAAYKHVPIVESNPEEAIAVNIYGTLNVLDISLKHRADYVTLISTDKAVRPANYMGATKRIAEMILQAKSKLGHKTVICSVRFGNVLGSSGSVVPKFKQQIANGGPITVTDKDITRYFMTIPEASQLVLQASALAEGGEIFVLDMGQPIRIYDFARLMVQLSGKTIKSDKDPYGDIEIREIGLRPGEKMYEELFIDDNIKRTTSKKILLTREAGVDWTELSEILADSGENYFGGHTLRTFLDHIKTDNSVVSTQQHDSVTLPA